MGNEESVSRAEPTMESFEGIGIKEVEENIKERVEFWKKDPPKPLKMTEFKHKVNFSAVRRLLLRAVLTTIESIERLKNSSQPRAPQALKETQDSLREFLKIAVYLEMFPLGVIQKNAIELGVVPDPKTGWKFYKGEGKYFCWECDTPAEIKMINNQKILICPGCGAKAIILGDLGV